MNDYKTLLAQRASLDLQISRAKAEESAVAAATVRSLVIEYDLTREDVFPVSAARVVNSLARRPVAIKYRGPAGETWTGRGLEPRWLKGLNRADWLIVG